MATAKKQLGDGRGVQVAEALVSCRLSPTAKPYFSHSLSLSLTKLRIIRCIYICYRKLVEGIYVLYTVNILLGT